MVPRWHPKLHQLLGLVSSLIPDSIVGVFQPNAATNTDYVEIKSNGWFNIALTILFDDLSDYRLIKADVFKVVMILMVIMKL